MKVLLVLIWVGAVRIQNGESSPSTTKEILVIPKTNLLTGVFYRISLPNYPFSVLTWAEVSTTSNPDTKFIQMDDHESRIPNYAKGGEWYRAGLWFLKASDRPGFVTIHNAATPTKVMSVSDLPDSPEAEAPLDHYLTLSGLGRGEDFGITKNETMWEIVPSTEPDTYYLRNFGVRGLAATMLRFGGFYKWVKVNFQSSLGDQVISSNCNMDSTLFKFKAEAVDLDTESKFWN